MLPFQIDLSRLSYATALEIIAPILPGGTIAVGWLYGHEAMWGTVHDEKTLKMIIVVFIVYVVGLVVLYLSLFELGMIALAILSRKKIEFPEPWKTVEWRELASKFLGADLSPPVDEPPTEPSKQSLRPTNAESLSKSIRENFARRMAPVNFQTQWQKWYEILKARFPMSANTQYAFGSAYFSTLNSIGWAGLVAAYISFRHVSWLVWFACILTIIVSHISFTVNFSQQQRPDPSGDHLAAELLKAIEDRKSDFDSHDAVE